MQLKEYQQRALDTIRSYLQLLSAWRKKAGDNPGLEIDFPAKAWEKAGIPRRGMTHTEFGYRILERVKESLADVGLPEPSVRMEGRHMSLIINPKRAPVKAKDDDRRPAEPKKEGHPLMPPEAVPPAVPAPTVASEELSA